jgi:drug/metabolite transporter (DMT)-like permease
MGAHILVNRSFKHAEAAVVMPYQYSLLIWAILFGAVFFADTPRPAMLLGAGLIMASGLFIARLSRA